MYEVGFKFRVAETGTIAEIVSPRALVNYFGERFVYTVRYGDWYTTVFESTIENNFKAGVYELLEEKSAEQIYEERARVAEEAYIARGTDFYNED